MRALKQVHSSSELRSRVLASNSGWQPIYTEQIEAKQGDVVRAIGQIQLTVDSVPQVGQQLRLLVNGQPVGSQAIEINTQPGSHHLPMLVTGIHLASEDGPLTVALEASSFHSEGDFPVTVDYADNLFYGSLITEQYRSYPDLATAWADGALLLTDIHQPTALTREVWSVAPYVQEPLASLTIPANQGDVLRPSGQAVAAGSHGLEQFTGVLTVDGRPISPYGGQNVVPENPTAPMLIEGFDQVAKDGQQFLEYRIYGAFGHGLTLLPDTSRFEVAHYSSYGRELKDFGHEQIAVDTLMSDGEPVEVYSRVIALGDSDLLRVNGNLQFNKPQSDQTVECRLWLQVDGPAGSFSSTSQKSLTPTKAVLPLASFLTVRATQPGLYRISLKTSGRSDGINLPLKLDSQNSQLQYFHFALPR